MTRLIDADALKDFYGKWSNEHTEFTKPEVDHYIDVQPTIEAEPVRHGRWETHNQVDSVFYCSECKLNVSGFERRWLNFCPNCGAKMDGDQ